MSSTPPTVGGALRRGWFMVARAMDAGDPGWWSRKVVYTVDFLAGFVVAVVTSPLGCVCGKGCSGGRCWHVLLL